MNLGSACSPEQRFGKTVALAKTDLKIEFAELRVQIQQVKAELKVEIAQVKTDLVRWLFLFWIGQMGVVVGLIFGLFAFFKN